MATQPDLGIKDPYALDEKQLAAAVDLLKAQSANVGEYWSDYLKEIQAFKTGSSTVGTTWQVIANLAQAEKAKVDVVLPKEGATGWSDTWMVGAKSQAKTCALQVAWTTSSRRRPTPRSPSGSVRRRPTRRPAPRPRTRTTAQTFHAEDEAYFSKVDYWNTPIEDCLDGRTDVKCTDYATWTKAWTEIRNS